MIKAIPAKVQEQTISDWFDLLDEAYINSLIALHDDHEITSNKAWHYVFGELSSANCTCRACLLSLPARRTCLRPVPAQEIQSESFAAPALEAQGQGTLDLNTFNVLQAWLFELAFDFGGEANNPCATEADVQKYLAERASVGIASSLLFRFKNENIGRFA